MASKEKKNATADEPIEGQLSIEPTAEQLQEWKKSPAHLDDGTSLGSFGGPPKKPESSTEGEGL